MSTIDRTLLVHADAAVLHAYLVQHHDRFPLVVTTNLMAMRFLRRQAGNTLKTITLRQVAREVLRQAGLRVLQPFEGREVLWQVMQNTPLQYLPCTTASLRQVQRIFAELMHAAVKAQAVAEVVGSEREEDLARLYRAYLQHLQDHQLADGAAMEFFAAEHVKTPAVHLVTGYLFYDPAQLNLLDRMCAPGSVVTVTSGPHMALTRARSAVLTLSSLGWKVQPLPKQEPLTVGSKAVRQWFQGETGPLEGVSFTTFQTPEQEVKHVLGTVAGLLDTVPHHDLVVVVRDEATYLPLIRETARRLNLPIISGQTLPLKRSHPARLVLALIEANLHGWRHRAALGVLQHPLSRFTEEVIENRLNAVRPPESLTEWHLSENPEPLVLPRQGTGALYRKKFMAALDFLGCQEKVKGTYQTAVSLGLLTHVLDSLEALEDLDLETLRSHLLQDFEDVGVPMVLSRVGVRVAGPLSLSGRQYRHVFVVGLSDTLFPLRPAQDPLLDDHTRARWEQGGVKLFRLGERMQTERAYFHAVVNAATERLHLSRPAFSDAGKELPISPMVSSFVACAPLPDLPQGAPLQDVQERIQLETSRLQEEVCAHNGQVRQARVPAEHRWSASQLKSFGNCRFKWFAEKMLHLRSFPHLPEALEARTEGTFFHRVLEHLLRPHLGLEVDRNALLTELEGAFRKTEQEMRRSGSLPPLRMWSHLKPELLQALRKVVLSPAFLTTGSQVVELEKTFEHTLHLPEGPFHFSGVMDRIDLAPQGKQILDYKRGESVGGVKGPDGKTLDIQMPLYLMASQARLGRYLSIKKPARSLKKAGPDHKEKDYSWTLHQGQVLDFLSGVLSEVRQQNFRPEVSNACTFCDFAAVCRLKGARL